MTMSKISERPSRPGKLDFGDTKIIDLSLSACPTEGHRDFDVLHVATALHLGASEFLTFDANQKRLAQAEGLVVPL